MSTKWKLRLPDWQTMEPIIDWQQKALRFDIAGMNQIMAQIIEAWPYEGNPRDPQAYRALTPGQWKEAVTQVGQKIGSFFQLAADGDLESSLRGSAAAPGADRAAPDAAD